MNGHISGKCFLILISENKQQVYFLKKLNQGGPLPLDFNDNTVQTVEVHKYLSLDKKVDFNIHIDNKIYVTK